MKKLCIAVGFNGPTDRKSDGPLVFLYAWTKFLERNRAKFPFDFVFVYAGLPKERVEEIVGGIVPTFSLKDWSIAYGLVYPGILYAEGYEYVMHIDHDAFPSVSFLNDIYTLLCDHSEIDFLTSSNFPRGLAACSDESLCVEYRAKTIKDGKEVWKFFPFGYPPDSGDVWAIKREFFFEAQRRMLSRPGCLGNPIINYTLLAGDVMDILGVDASFLKKDISKATIFIDGALQGDIWVDICALKPVMAGILSPAGKSFRLKNSLQLWPIETTEWDKVVDWEDLSYPHKLNVYNDELFHMENGYIAWWHWAPMIDKDHIDPCCNMYLSFQGENPGFYVRHFALAHLLAQKSDCPELLTSLNVGIDSLLTFLGSNKDKFWDKVSLYQGRCLLPLREYT